MPEERDHRIDPADGLPAAEKLIAGRYLDYYRVWHDPHHPDRRWEYVRRPGGRNGVNLVATTPDARLLLIEQFRWPLRKFVLELPAGMTEATDRGGFHAAARELEEETGAQFGALRFLASGPLLPGITDEENDFYHAEVTVHAERIGGGCALDVRAGNRAEGEHIRAVYAVPIADAAEWLEARRAEGKSVDLRTYVGLYLYERLRNT